MIAGVSEFIRACNEFYPDIEIHHRTHIAPNNVPDEVKTALYRVIQEALNNVGKHSRATSAQVELTEDEEEFKLQVADNGIGFDVSTTFDTGNPLQGYGLLGMKERVEICRGTFKVESTPGKGTRLFASIPKNP